MKSLNTKFSSGDIAPKMSASAYGTDLDSGGNKAWEESRKLQLAYQKIEASKDRFMFISRLMEVIESELFVISDQYSRPYLTNLKSIIKQAKQATKKLEKADKKLFEQS